MKTCISYKWNEYPSAIWMTLGMKSKESGWLISIDSIISVDNNLS